MATATGRIAARSARSGSCPRSPAAARPRRRPMVDRVLARGRKGDGDGASGASAAPMDPKAAMWQRVQLARNLARPRTLEFLRHIADEVIELHGDRGFGDDAAIVAGFARIEGRRIAFV